MELRSFMYKDMLVPEYCAKRDIPFREVDARYNRMRKNKKLDKFDDEYLVDYIFRTFYPDKPKTNSPYNCKYFVDDVPVSEFAKQNKMTVFSVRGAIRRGLKKDPEVDTSRVAKEFVKRSKDKIIYTYDNYPLPIACKMFNLSNATVLRIFHEENPDSDKMTIKEINAAIKEIVDNMREANNNNNNNKSMVLKREI